MTDYFQTFVIGDYPAVVTEFIKTAQIANAKGQRATARLVAQTFVQLQSDLTAMSIRTAEIADQHIHAAIQSTAVRAVQTGQGPGGGLFDHIHSEPIQANAGIVGVGRISGAGGLDELDYWRAQEYGLGPGAGDNFLGRRIRGFFADDASGSNPLVPQSGISSQPIFGASKGGGVGIIRNPIEPRKFLDQGTAKAEAFWQAERVRVQARAVKRLSAALTRA